MTWQTLLYDFYKSSYINLIKTIAKQPVLPQKWPNLAYGRAAEVKLLLKCLAFYKLSNAVQHSLKWNSFLVKNRSNLQKIARNIKENLVLSQNRSYIRLFDTYFQNIFTFYSIFLKFSFKNSLANSKMPYLVNFLPTGVLFRSNFVVYDEIFDPKAAFLWRTQ